MYWLEFIYSYKYFLLSVMKIGFLSRILFLFASGTFAYGSYLSAQYVFSSCVSQLKPFTSSRYIQPGDFCLESRKYVIDKSGTSLILLAISMWGIAAISEKDFSKFEEKMRNIRRKLEED